MKNRFTAIGLALLLALLFCLPSQALAASLHLDDYVDLMNAQLEMLGIEVIDQFEGDDYIAYVTGSGTQVAVFLDAELHVEQVLIQASPEAPYYLEEIDDLIRGNMRVFHPTLAGMDEDRILTHVNLSRDMGGFPNEEASWTEDGFWYAVFYAGGVFSFALEDQRAETPQNRPRPEPQRYTPAPAPQNPPASTAVPSGALPTLEAFRQTFNAYVMAADKAFLAIPASAQAVGNELLHEIARVAMVSIYEEGGIVQSFQIVFAYEAVDPNDRTLINALAIAYDARLTETDLAQIIDALALLQPETYDGGGRSETRYDREYSFWRVDDVCEFWGEPDAW